MGCGQSKNAIGAVPKTGDGNEPKEKPVEESTPASPAKKVPIERPRSKTIQVKTSANNSPASTPKLNRKVCYIIGHQCEFMWYEGVRILVCVVFENDATPPTHK